MVTRPAWFLKFISQCNAELIHRCVLLFRVSGVFNYSFVLLWLIMMIDCSGYKAQAAPIKRIIEQYAITSANDFPQRDPTDWQLFASNDEGKTWIILDQRKGEFFHDRQERKLYRIENRAGYSMYRLQIDAIRDPGMVNPEVQLADLEFLGCNENSPELISFYIDAMSAQGENLPAESVKNLFDGRVDTKWLDPLTNKLKSSSWVQWQYGDPSGAMLTNISQLMALHSHSGDGHPVRISAVGVSYSARRDLLFVEDDNGCIQLDGILGAEAVSPGQLITITGTIFWKNNRPSLKKGQVQTKSLAKALEHFSLDQTFLPADNLKWVEVEGEIRNSHFQDGDILFDLQQNSSTLQVRWHCPDNSSALPSTKARGSVRGILQGAFNQQGHWIPASLRAVGEDAVTLLDIKNNTSSSTNQLGLDELATTNFLTITKIRQITSLTTEQVQLRPKVKVGGIVTGLVGGFLQDDTGGIGFDNLPESESQKLSAIGDYIEIDGQVTQGEFGTKVIAAQHVKVLGKGRLPEPIKLPLSQLINGRIDSQWIQFQGVVHASDGSHLLIVNEDGQLTASVDQAVDKQVKMLVDSEIRARGVGVISMDDQGRIQGMHLLIPSLEQVEVIKPPMNASTLPLQTIKSLFDLNKPQGPFHRVKIEGIVTLSFKDKFYIQDDTGSAMAIPRKKVELKGGLGRSRWLYWRNSQAEEASDGGVGLSPGERVQVVGFLETYRYSSILTEAIVTKLEGREKINPVNVTPEGIQEGGLDSKLIRLEGLIRGQHRVGDSSVLDLEWRDRIIQVLVPGSPNNFPSIALGSRLQVTGICELQSSHYTQLGLGVDVMRIQTRFAQDVEVLEKPSWWTIGHAMGLIGGMMAVLLAGLIWIKELRRQVGERGRQLKVEIELREKNQHQHELDQERARIARDLHDDLGANLTQIIFLSERIDVARHENLDATPWQKQIFTTARLTIQSLDEIVWAINPRHDSLESLANYLTQFAQDHLALAGVRCLLDVPMVLPNIPLTAEVRHNLLLTTREAIQNAVTHAKATEVHLSLNLDSNGLLISIIDNGSGFNAELDLEDGNGLKNMHSRMEAINGRLEILSHPGQGTKVYIRLLHNRVIGVQGII